MRLLRGTAGCPRSMMPRPAQHHDARSFSSAGQPGAGGPMNEGCLKVRRFGPGTMVDGGVEERVRFLLERNSPGGAPLSGP